MKEWREEAFQDYIDGMKYPEIAKKHGISLSAVKKCAVTYWSKKKATEKVTEDETVTSKKVTKQPPPRKKGGANNFKHGAYEQIYWDCLDDTENAMIQSMQFDKEEQLLIEQMQLLTVRERRLLHRIKEFENKKGGLALDSVTKRTAEENGNKIQNEVTTHTISTFEVIQKLEAELTKVQGRKTKCIESLEKIRTGREELAIKKRELAIKESQLEQTQQTYIEDLEPLAEMINRNESN